MTELKGSAECKQVHGMLSAFLEGILSPNEKKLVLEHLGACKECRQALAEAKKVVQLIRDLGEVEPPPWFTQKVMGKIREETERKKRGLLSRLFYPLHVKVPMQALASVLIVVLALYVYRSVEPEMKVAQTPSDTAYEKGTILQDRLQQSRGKADRAAKAPSPSSPASEPAKVEKNEEAADRQTQGLSTATPSPKQREPVQEEKVVLPAAARREAETTVSGGTGATMKQSPGVPAPQAAPEHRLSIAKKTEQTNITLRANDVITATVEVKELLSQLGARSIAAESHSGRALITAELGVQRIEEFFKKLRDLGQVEEKGLPPAFAEGLVSIRIEVTGKP